MDINYDIYDVVLICDFKGKILKIRKDNMNFKRFPIKGQNIIDSVQKGNESKYMKFFYGILSNYRLYKYEIKLVLDEKSENLYFTGSKINDNSIIILMNKEKEKVEENREQINHIKKEVICKNNPNDKIVSEDFLKTNKRIKALKNSLINKEEEVNFLNKKVDSYTNILEEVLLFLETIKFYEEYFISESYNSKGLKDDSLLKYIYKLNEEKISLINGNNSELLDSEEEKNINFKELLDKVIELNHTIIEDKSIVVTLKCGVYYIKVPQKRFTFILNYIIINSIKNCENKDKIDLKVDAFEENLILSIKFKHNNSQLVEFNEDDMEYVRKILQKYNCNMWLASEGKAYLGIYMVFPCSTHVVEK